MAPMYARGMNGGYWALDNQKFLDFSGNNGEVVISIIALSQILMSMQSQSVV